MSLEITTMVDGEVKQSYKTSDMFFDVLRLSAFIHDMTLNPGDIIACGTNSGLGPMTSGQTVTVNVSSIGKVTNAFKITVFSKHQKSIWTRLRNSIKVYFIFAIINENVFLLLYPTRLHLSL